MVSKKAVKKSMTMVDCSHFLAITVDVLFTLYSTVVLHIRDHEGLGFLANNITLKPSSQYHYGTLAVLFRHNQAQKCFQYGHKSFQ